MGEWRDISTAPRDPLAEAAREAHEAVNARSPDKEQKVERVRRMLWGMLELQMASGQPRVIH